MSLGSFTLLSSDRSKLLIASLRTSGNLRRSDLKWSTGVARVDVARQDRREDVVLNPLDVLSGRARCPEPLTGSVPL